jgi:two-component system, OmpR family, phosphate regulon sensor histidine kinase PhoR
MRLNYKQKLFIYLFAIFSLFTVGVTLFEHSREKKFRIESIEKNLNVYSEIFHQAIKDHYNNPEIIIDSIRYLFPENLRLTIINQEGIVLYDNAIQDISKLENHFSRKEVVKAREEGSGSDIRKSNSTKQEYVYYAKKYENYYIRVALPYNRELKTYLRSDSIFFYFIFVLFIVSLILFNLLATKVGRSIKKLRDFIQSTETKGNQTYELNFSDFPDDELGDLSRKIVNNYKKIKESEKKVLMEREKLLQHVQSSEEGICFYSSDKKVDFFNGLFLQYLNFLVDGANSDPENIFYGDLFIPINDFISTRKRGEKYFESQITKQAREFSVQVNIFDDESFEITLNDITKQQRISMLKREITANIAHELRTPVTSIRGFLETVIEQNLDQEKKDYFINKAYNKTIVLSEIIQDVSMISRIEDAPLSFEIEDVSIAAIIQLLHSEFKETFREKEIVMEWDVTDKVIVKGNYSLIYAIFRNLIDNAVRYAGTSIKIKISNYNEVADYFYFSFFDTGVGIPDEKHLSRLFERFYRVNEGRTRDTGGSGLGLSIVKNAVLMHQGTIFVKNRQGGGLEFLFSLKKS